jgi:hypothetical protein
MGGTESKSKGRKEGARGRPCFSWRLVSAHWLAAFFLLLIGGYQKRRKQRGVFAAPGL